MICKIPSCIADVSKAGPLQQATWGPNDDPSKPPPTLMDHAPLAIFTNGVLAAFNELRHCAPLSLAPAVASLLQVGHSPVLLLRQLHLALHSFWVGSLV